MGRRRGRRTDDGPRGLSLPEGWTLVHAWGPGPFTTHALLERPDGSRTEWTSRRHRKRLGLVVPFDQRYDRMAQRLGGRASASSWWMGALFAVGSICFALGSLPPYFENLSTAAVAKTFFIGSIFFTSAAYLQFRESVSSPTGVEASSPRRRYLASLVGWRPRCIDWWSAVVQLVGTIWFNVSTWAATRTDLTSDQQRHLIWAPDLLGSVCFLVASWLAYSEVNPRVRPRPDGSVGWRIAAMNLAGSLAFGLAAIGARYLRTTGDVANIALVNTGTFVGAAFFLAGAALLPVESARDRGSAVAA